MNDLLLLLGVAFALDLLIGDPHSPLHPVALFGNYAAKVEAFARRRFGSTVRAGFLGWCLAALPPALFAAGSILLVRRGFGPHAAAVAAGYEMDDLHVCLRKKYLSGNGGIWYNSRRAAGKSRGCFSHVL